MTPSRRLAIAGLALMGAGALWWATRGESGAARAEALYATPLSPPDGALDVYHLGHSLVGRDMPAMLAQLAGHAYASQLGWGTSLREHWEPDQPINGFDTENAHDRFRPAKEAVGSGDYQAVILTEMVEIADAVRYHASAKYLALWAGQAVRANPGTRVYLYETWHHTNDPDGWVTRIDRDLPTFWLGKVLHPALAQTEAPIYLIPAGQVMAAFVRRLELGGVDFQSEALFAISEDGTRDTIHLSDIGAYLVALTHYAVLYHRAPAGLPHVLMRADGSPAEAPSAEVAQLMQDIVWQVVTRHPETGVAA